jgi:iron complex transport system substrate-binding protein
MIGSSGETMSRKFVIGLLIVALFLAACGSSTTATPAPAATQPAATELPTATLSPTAAPIVLTDDLGRTVMLASPAQRIISLAPSNTEILFAVGAGAQVVGRDEASDYPEEVKPLPTVGGWSGFSTESIVALHPDLVLAADTIPAELVASLEGLGLTVYRLANPLTLEDLYANLETVGTLTGHEEDALTLVDSLQVRVAAVDAKISTVTERPIVYYELDATNPTKPFTSGPGTFMDLLISRAGGSNVAADLTSQWAEISLEQIVVANPDFIILGDSAYGTTAESVKQRPGWNQLAAVQNDRIFPFDDNLVSRPGPRLVDGLEALAKLLHPDLFQ